MSREHGTRAKYVIERCHCDLCRQANRAYAHFDQKRRRLQRTTGTWAMPFVDAGPTRDHLVDLAAVGIGQRRVAELADVRRNTIREILAGRPRVRRETALRILAVTNSPADGALVDATDTWAMIRWILEQPGWTKVRLAGELGLGDSLQLGRLHITARNARSVKRLHDQVWKDRLARRAS